MTPLVWWLATRAQRQRIVEAASRSSCGYGHAPSSDGDRFLLVCRGHDPPAANLDAGRAAGGVPSDRVAAWIANFLAADRRHLAVFEDVIHSPGDFAVLACTREYWELPQGVAWPMFAGESAAAVHDAMSMHRGGPRTVLLFRLPPHWPVPGNGASLSVKLLQSLRESVCAVMSDVYDGDAWLIWDRHASTVLRVSIEQDAEPGIAASMKSGGQADRGHWEEPDS